MVWHCDSTCIHALAWKDRIHPDLRQTQASVMEPESGKFIFRATTHSVSTRSMLFLFAALLATLSASAHADGQEAASPYPPSPVIERITWHWETYQNASPGSDLWPVTWGIDDNLYA